MALDPNHVLMMIFCLLAGLCLGALISDGRAWKRKYRKSEAKVRQLTQERFHLQRAQREALRTIARLEAASWSSEVHRQPPKSTFTDKP